MNEAKSAAIAELLLGYGADIDARYFREGAAGEGLGVLPAAGSSASVGGAFGLGTSSLTWRMQATSGPRPVSQQRETSRTTIRPPAKSASQVAPAEPRKKRRSGGVPALCHSRGRSD